MASPEPSIATAGAQLLFGPVEISTGTSQFVPAAPAPGTKCVAKMLERTPSRRHTIIPLPPEERASAPRFAFAVVRASRAVGGCQPRSVSAGRGNGTAAERSIGAAGPETAR